MHEARQRLMNEQNRIMGEAAQAGALQSNRIIVAISKVANKNHKNSMGRAKALPVLQVASALQVPPADITEMPVPFSKL